MVVPDSRPTGRARLEITIVILTVVLSGMVSWLVSFYQTETSKRDRRVESKAACFDRAVKDFSTYRSTAMIYFFDRLGTTKGGDSADAKHVAYHNQEAELRTCLQIIPLLFGSAVKQKAEELTAYLLENPWEEIIESRAFTEDMKGLATSDSGIDSITTLITNRVDDSTYLELTRDLTRLMAEEITPGHSNSVQSFAPVDASCVVTPREARVGERVTFDAIVRGGTGEFVFTWQGDDGISSEQPRFSHAFATPGIKKLHVRVTSNGQSVYRQCEITIVP